MRETLRRTAVCYFSGALAALAVMVLAWLLGRADLGPLQEELSAPTLFHQVGLGALLGTVLGLVLHYPERRVLLAGAVLGTALGLYAWITRQPWPRGEAAQYVVGYWALWGILAGSVAVWLKGR